MTSRYIEFSEIEFVITNKVHGAESFQKSWPSWARQEIPRILWNLKICYRMHKRSPLVPIMSQIKPVHAPNPTSWRSILISPYLLLDLPSGLFPSGFHTKTLYAALHICYVARPFHSSWFYRQDNIWWAVQVIKLNIMQLSPLLSSPLGPDIFLGTLRSSLIVSDQVS
jgi:hypothetical protein